MLKEVAYGEWAPDLAPSHDKHLTIAQNVLPIANGYVPVGDFQSITTALAGGPFLGGGMFVNSSGSIFLFAGRTGELDLWNGSAWAVAASPAGQTHPWRLAQWGDYIMGSWGGALLAFNMNVGGAFSGISGAPSNAIDVARVRDFVMVVTADNQAVWSSFNDYTGWTSGVNQSDFQPLLSGGAGIGIVGGEYGIIFQTNAIKRVTYVGEPQGADIIFQFDDISQEVGCMVQGSICSVGRLIFFLSERGFMMCDGETVTPIADEKFNRWFFRTFSRTDVQNMFSAIDPQRSIAWWSMPGNPGYLIAYNWVLKRASVIRTSVEGVMSGYTTGTTLEALDTTYPGGLDTIPISLDDASLNGGSPQLLIVNISREVGTLSGTALEATLKQKNIELTPGLRSRVRTIRPVTDATSASAVINAKMRAGDGEALVSTSTMRSNGKLPVRANGRYLDTTLTIPAGAQWTYLQACEYEFEPGDGR